MGAPLLIILPHPDCAAEVLEAKGCHIFKCKGKKNTLKGSHVFLFCYFCLKNTSLVHFGEMLLFMQIHYKIKSSFVTWAKILRNASRDALMKDLFYLFLFLCVFKKKISGKSKATWSQEHMMSEIWLWPDVDKIHFIWALNTCTFII